MAQLPQWYNVLWQKLKPSMDIQQRGSVHVPLKSSTLFGPQFKSSSYQSFAHKQNPHIKTQLEKMDK